MDGNKDLLEAVSIDIGRRKPTDRLTRSEVSKRYLVVRPVARMLRVRGQYVGPSIVRPGHQN